MLRGCTVQSNGERAGRPSTFAARKFHFEVKLPLTELGPAFVRWAFLSEGIVGSILIYLDFPTGVRPRIPTTRYERTFNSKGATKQGRVDRREGSIPPFDKGPGASIMVCGCMTPGGSLQLPHLRH